MTTLLVRIFWQTGRFPREILALPKLERDLVIQGAMWVLEQENKEAQALEAQSSRRR